MSNFNGIAKDFNQDLATSTRPTEIQAVTWFPSFVKHKRILDNNGEKESRKIDYILAGSDLLEIIGLELENRYYSWIEHNFPYGDVSILAKKKKYCDDGLVGKPPYNISDPKDEFKYFNNGRGYPVFYIGTNRDVTNGCIILMSDFFDNAEKRKINKKTGSCAVNGEFSYYLANDYFTWGFENFEPYVIKKSKEWYKK